MNHYELHRQQLERINGFHNPGALGISGWKGITWAGLRWMYQHGKLTREKAEQIRELIAVRYSPKSQVHKGFTRTDHQAHDQTLGLDRVVKTPQPKKQGRQRMVESANKGEERTQATIGARIAELEAELALLRSFDKATI